MNTIIRTTHDSIELDDEVLEGLRAFLADACAGKTVDSNVAEIVERVDQYLRDGQADLTEEF